MSEWGADGMDRLANGVLMVWIGGIGLALGILGFYAEGAYAFAMGAFYRLTLHHKVPR